MHSGYSKSFQSASCDRIFNGLDFDDRIPTLNRIANAFYNRCYAEVIEYGTRAQSEYRYKTFSLSKEVSTLFMPEDVLLDYVMESYERGYLTFLLMASHYKLGDAESARVELRRLNDEMGVDLYNFGRDPVNVLFQAMMWETLGEPAESRVDWKTLGSLKDLDEPVRKFGEHRIDRIDAAHPLDSDWKIFAVGEFPEIDWDLRFKKADSGYFAVYGKEPFLPDCSSEKGLRISTKSWLHKIAIRHDDAYHPLVNAKSWIRLPIGIIYGITTFTAGAGIAVGGCAFDAYGQGDGSLCAVSIQGGAALMTQSPQVIRYSLKPDLRHWENIPSSFVFTTEESPENEVCLREVNAEIPSRQIF